MLISEFTEAAKAILEGTNGNQNVVELAEQPVGWQGPFLRTVHIQYATGFEKATIVAHFLVMEDWSAGFINDPVLCYGWKSDTSFQHFHFHSAGPKDVDAEMQSLLNWLADNVGEPRDAVEA
jgi:hypothetical protein